MFSYAVGRFGRLVNKLGVSVTLSRSTGTFNSVTGKVTPGAPLTWTGSGIVSEYEGEFEGKSDVGASLLSVLIPGPGLTFVPQEGDSVAFGGRNYRVLKVNPGYIGPSIPSYELVTKG